MNELLHDIELLRRWAEANPIVERVWIFGSRARGDSRPDSDLDVAVEHGVMSGDGDHFTTGLCVPSEWSAELQPEAKLKLDIWSYRPGDTPTIEAGLREASQIIYERAT